MVSHQPTPPLGSRGNQPDAIAPDGSEIRLLIDGRHHAPPGSLVKVTLPADRVSRPVLHRTVEEVWYVLEGRGRVWRWPDSAPAESAPPLDVSPGDAVAIPNRVAVPVECGPSNLTKSRTFALRLVLDL